jgi:hypothetical protein
MDPIMLTVITGFMAFIQIEFWLMFPKKLRDILVANPIFAFIIEFISSLSITVFTGVASFVGLCNILAGIIFVIWALIYKKQQGITGLGFGWYKAWNWIPLFPKVLVNYNLNGKKWSL